MSKRTKSPSPPQSDRWFTIDEAAKECNLSAAYIRAQVRFKVLPSKLEPLTPGSLTKRHLINEDDLRAFQNRDGAKSRRSDGRNKWVFYGTIEEMRMAKEALFTSPLPLREVALSIQSANHIKAAYELEQNNVTVQSEMSEGSEQ